MLEHSDRAYLHIAWPARAPLLISQNDTGRGAVPQGPRGSDRWGIVSDGPAVRLRDGARASSVTGMARRSTPRRERVSAAASWIGTSSAS